MGFGNVFKRIGAAINPTVLLGTGAQIAGDYMAAKQAGQDADSAREANMYMSEADRQMQREFAQNGIRWRAEDAVRAGFHPLAALGASGASYQNSAIQIDGSSPKGEFYSRLGQNVGRAINATSTQNERAVNALNLERMGLENAVLKKQLEGMSGPAFPGGDNFLRGQGNTNSTMDIRPVRVNVSQPGRAAQEAGWRPDVSYSRTDTGLVPMIPEGLSESLEDDLVGQIMWRIRNQLMPNLTGSGAPPRSQLPKGKNQWRWDKVKQEWTPYGTHRRSFGREIYEKFRYGR